MDLVRDESDLTAYPGIGEAIGSAIREIVRTGTLGKLEKLRSAASPEFGDHRLSEAGPQAGYARL